MNDLLKKRIHSIFFMISSSLLLLFFSTILSPAEMAVANPSASASNSIDANGASSSANLVKNGDFSDGDTHWFVTGETDTSGGALCATIPGGTVSPWDAQISQGEIQLESKHFYKLTFDMLASTDGAVVNAIIGQDQYPWAQYYATSLSLRSILQHYQFIMQAPAEAGASGFFLHIGGTTAERFCLDNVSLTDIGQSSGPTPTPIPNPPPVIFDDFSYNSSDLNTISANGIHSIFGVNPWMTETGEIDSRFWRRYNWDDLYMGPNVTVSASAEGMKLTALAGLDVDKDPDPAIFSGVAFPNRGAGTYHALIRFDDLASDIRTIQAFWNFALNQYAFVDESGATYLPRGEPSYIASETDIEWNNWFTGDSIARLSAANHLGTNYDLGASKSVGENLQCLYRDSDGTITAYPDCIGSIGGAPLIANQWLNTMIVVNDVTETVAYSMWIDDWAGSDGILWIGGSTDRWGQPFILQSYFPTTPMVSVFSQHFFAREGSGTTQLTQDQVLDINYFYYSPRTDLSVTDVQNDVKRLRADGLVRVNTTGLDFQGDRSFELSITGADTLGLNEIEKWSVSGSSFGTRFDVHYHYRLHRPEGWTAWYNISALDLILMADSSFDQVEMEATAWNFWNKGQVTSASRLVQVTATPSNPGGAMDEFVSLPMIFR